MKCQTISKYDVLVADAIKDFRANSGVYFCDIHEYTCALIQYAWTTLLSLSPFLHGNAVRYQNLIEALKSYSIDYHIYDREYTQIKLPNNNYEIIRTGEIVEIGPEDAIESGGYCHIKTDDEKGFVKFMMNFDKNVMPPILKAAPEAYDKYIRDIKNERNFRNRKYGPSA